MLVPLSPIDNAVADMGITCGYVFARPAGAASDDAGTALLAELEAATRRVVAKWPLLQGHAVWQKEKGIWGVDVPDEPLTTSRPFLFSSTRIAKPYAKAASLSAPLEPLERTSSPCAFQPAHKLSFFRSASLPTTFAGYAKSHASFLAVHATLFADVVAVGLTAPHGLVDATGLGWAVRALGAELHGEAWAVPPLAMDAQGDNVLAVGLEAIKRGPERTRDGELDGGAVALEGDEDDGDVESSAAKHALAGWVSASSLKNVACFLANYAWEKLRNHDEPRHVFLSRRAVDALVDSVKAEVRRETGGKEWVSTGDVLTAWALKAVHADEATSHTAAAVSPVFALRDLLSLASYPHNAVAPYPFSPSPIPLSTLATTSIGSLALTHRRSLDKARTRPFVRATLARMDELAWSNGGQVPIMPARAWPWHLGWVGALAARRRRSGTSSRTGGDEEHEAPSHHWIVSNQMVSGLADLTLPASLFDVAASSGAPRSKASSASSSSSTSRPVDLALLGFYVRITATIKDHQAFRFQVNAEGVFLEGSMRRTRWRALGRAVERLERDFGHAAAATAVASEK
ncbi:uncharacterized protein RHOBADRAFT_51660 [Rhodotorula graminis WP1]|uniref:Uncharacterized protein n=1 Tax=Rhodotorula graminis (strain WP1) TaxID=578459 RepID=A0A194SBM9_RHOGW|nr:uncharacterized protein RHOBADRAFT_51660 [Rhodotorula graminis WP1]KPV77860.1 hypothetical protein RHOBADRAFT_51660 [Rhodotorula graminis WP1]